MKNAALMTVPSTAAPATVGSQELVEPVVGELFERLKNGHSLRSIAADFRLRGIRSRQGAVFSPQFLKHGPQTYAQLPGWL